MARNFYSSAYTGGVPFRALGDQPTEITATAAIPAAYVLQTADKIYMMKIGANMQVLEVTMRSEDIDTDATPAVTLHCGYEAVTASDDPDAFVAASTIGQAGGSIRVENGGDDAFAVGGLAPIAETIDVLVTAGTAADANSATTAKKITVTMKIAPVVAVADANQPSYIYTDRYDTSGVSTT